MPVIPMQGPISLASYPELIDTSWKGQLGRRAWSPTMQRGAVTFMKYANPLTAPRRNRQQG